MTNLINSSAWIILRWIFIVPLLLIRVYSYCWSWSAISLWILFAWMLYLTWPRSMTVICPYCLNLSSACSWMNNLIYFYVYIWSCLRAFYIGDEDWYHFCYPICSIMEQIFRIIYFLPVWLRWDHKNIDNQQFG